jgi:hypothetical protein
MEFCANCSQWKQTIIEETGWCPECTVDSQPGLKVCTGCGGLFSRKAQVSQCWNCRREVWLSASADNIEVYMAEGSSFTAACERVSNDRRPVCKNCGQEIRGGRSGTNFCAKYPECKKASRVFRALKQTGLTPDDALAIATHSVLILVSRRTGEKDGVVYPNQARCV